MWAQALVDRGCPICGVIPCGMSIAHMLLNATHQQVYSLRCESCHLRKGPHYGVIKFTLADKLEEALPMLSELKMVEHGYFAFPKSAFEGEAVCPLTGCGYRSPEYMMLNFALEGMNAFSYKRYTGKGGVPCFFARCPDCDSAKPRRKSHIIIPVARIKSGADRYKRPVE